MCVCVCARGGPRALPAVHWVGIINRLARSTESGLRGRGEFRVIVGRTHASGRAVRARTENARSGARDYLEMFSHGLRTFFVEKK